MSSKAKGFYLFASVLFGASVCFADGGGPLLLMLNGFVFTLGQVWILVAEFTYLLLLFGFYRFKNAVVATIVMNVLSTLLGAILFPFLLALITLPGVWYSRSPVGGFVMAMGSWIAGDNSPFPSVAMGVVVVGFVVTYFLTVWIEYRYLQKYLNKHALVVGGKLLTHCYLLNGLSYLGLVSAFVIYPRLWGWL